MKNSHNIIYCGIVLMMIIGSLPLAAADGDIDAAERAQTEDQLENAVKELNAIAEEKRRDLEKEKKTTEDLSQEELYLGSGVVPSDEENTEEQETPRYERAKREFDDEYERGDLTRTEYIQRKRLLDEEEK